MLEVSALPLVVGYYCFMVLIVSLRFSPQKQ